MNEYFFPVILEIVNRLITIPNWIKQYTVYHFFKSIIMMMMIVVVIMNNKIYVTTNLLDTIYGDHSIQ
jgi:hypothetical protein